MFAKLQIKDEPTMKNPTRRSARVAMAAAFTGLALSFSPASYSAKPADFPSRPVSIVVPFVPGGATDLVARKLADALSERWSSSVVVVNRPGASGAIGTEYVARAKPDGYTVLLGTQTALAVTPTLSPGTIKYKPLEDFSPVTLLVTTPLVLLVSDQMKANSASEFVQMLKDNPLKYTYGSSGIGTSQHLTTLMFLNRIGSDAVHVPYKGTGQSLVDLGGGQVSFQFDNLATGLAAAKRGGITALAVTGDTPTALAPALPTIAESGAPGFSTSTWLGLLAPAGLPDPILKFLNSEVVEILKSDRLRDWFATNGFTPKPTSSEGFGQFIKEETARFSDLISKNKIAVQ
jgi:tripartite-type tricarboxylate transporter receptor subunit TctC